MRHGYSRGQWARERRTETGYDVTSYARVMQRDQFFTTASKDEGVTALETTTVSYSLERATSSSLMEFCVDDMPASLPTSITRASGLT